MKRYRVGIVGSGFGVKVHLPALLAHPKFDVTALASPNTAVAVAKERNIPHAFASCEEMVQGVELDTIVIASPPFAHRDDALAALRRGKHVLCEKPFALNVAQAEEIRDAAKSAGTACGLAHEFRFVPQRVAIAELVVNGHLKPLRNIEITQLGTFLRTGATRPRGWWFERARGGGITGAWMSHLVDSANHLVGQPPERVIGFSRTANAQRHDANGPFASDVADGCFAVLDYGEGLAARVAVDGTADVEQSTLAVHAENRTAVASGTSIIEPRLFSIDDEETNELDCKPSNYAKFASINPNVPLMMDLYDEWIKQIETGSSALPTFDEGVATQRVLAELGYSV